MKKTNISVIGLGSMGLALAKTLIQSDSKISVWNRTLSKSQDLNNKGDNFIDAQKNISRLILQEDFILLDKAFQLKILIADVIIRFKNGQHDIVQKIEDIRRNHKQLLLDEEYVRDSEMINIISKKIFDEDILDDKKRILSYMSDYDSKDLDIISYNIWLRNNL